MLLFITGALSIIGHKLEAGLSRLCKKIKLLADTEDFQTICMAVQRQIAFDKSTSDYSTLAKQMPVTTSTLIRRLFLRTPCVFDEYFQYMIKSLRSHQGTYIYLRKKCLESEETSLDVKACVGRFFHH